MRYKLEELFDLQMGKTPSRNNLNFWNTKENKWISIGDLSQSGKYICETKEYISDSAVKESGIKQIPANTVVMSFKLSIGKTAITSEDMYSNEAIMAFHDKHIVDLLPEYIYYLFKYRNWDEGTNKAVMGKVLNKVTLAKMEIDICPIQKQREIVELLDKLSYIIENRKSQVYALDNLIKARFVEMFGMPGTDRYGWGLVALGESCDINPPKNQDNRLVKDLIVSFVPMSAVSETGDINTSAIRKYDEVKTGFTYFSENDVLFAKITPCMENGKGAIAKGLYNGVGFGSTEFHILRPIAGKSNPYWVYVLTMFPEFRTDAANNMTGSAGQRRVPVSFLENYQVSVPPLDLQEKFADFVHQVDKSKVAREYIAA